MTPNVGDIVYFDIALVAIKCVVISVDHMLDQSILDAIDPAHKPTGSRFWTIDNYRIYYDSQAPILPIPPPPCPVLGAQKPAPPNAYNSIGPAGSLANNYVRQLQSMVKAMYDEIPEESFIGVDLASIKPLRVSKCECGTSSVGGFKHSDYCPLYHQSLK